MVGLRVGQQRPGLAEQPEVANGASEVLTRIFADAGRHARGAAELCLGASIEAELSAELAA